MSGHDALSSAVPTAEPTERSELEPECGTSRMSGDHVASPVANLPPLTPSYTFLMPESYLTTRKPVIELWKVYIAFLSCLAEVLREGGSAV
jgi:hypothetical protein